MTVIIGIVENGHVWIGADSAGTDESGWQTMYAESKVFPLGEAGDMLVGCSGNYRLMQLVELSLIVPAYKPGTDVRRYLVQDFIGALRECLKKAGYPKEDGKEHEMGGKLLIGFQGTLFEVQEDYHVGCATDGYNAIGSGATFALGALYATGSLPPQERVELALRAAAHHSAYVRPPFVIQNHSSVWATL